MFNLNAAAQCRSAVTVFSFLLLAGLYAAPLQAGPTELPDELDVVGGNSSNSRMFWLNYDAEDVLVNEAVQVNEDESSRPSLNSFTFFRNTCGPQRADVIAADINSNNLLLYRGGRGVGEPVCPAGDCVARPDGLSTSTAQLVAAVSVGGGGSVPAVWVLHPAECADGAQKTSFELGGGEHFSVPGQRIRNLADTEFVRVDGGGLVEGDLLVLSRSPAMIAHLTKNQVADGETNTGTVLVGSSFFGKTTPTGMAFVPGEGTDGNSAALLVTLSEGHVLKLTFSEDGLLPAPDDSTTWPSYVLKDSQGIFQNPRGIATGTRDGKPYLVIAEQNQGRYIRAGLENGVMGEIRSITANIESPQGVAILPELDEGPSGAQLCVDFDPVPGTPTTGCILENSIQVHLSQGYEGGLQEGDVVTAELIRFDDTRDGAYVSLDLPDEFPNFSIPANCRGFDVEGELLPQLVLLDMGINFNITPGNFIQITELASRSLGLEDQTCDQLGSRIYYHPQNPGGGVLFDTTFSCQNPSRSIVELFSPVVFCAEYLYLARVEKKATDGQVAGIQNQRQLVNDEIRERIAVLKDIIRELDADARFSGLAATLQTAVTSISNPQSSVPQMRYVEASRAADDGALAVFRHKELFREEPVILASDTYARLLSRFLSLAFYNWTTGALMDEQYGPPKAFCDASGTGFPELPDVLCSDYDPEQ